MPCKPPRPCRHPGCPELTREGWCDAHRPSWTGVRRRSAAYHHWYFLPIWTKKLRPEQLLREPWCAACLEKGCRVKATTADHIRPHRGDWSLFCDPKNLQSLCASCHGRKTLSEIREK
ncbi:MAG: HNH endonuclease [Oscillospiraceae bacterium]|nr:HNH endonuclease [Oscillospiraceae bacterium]MBR2366539.1 HNH endonuclease [Oscillospiraceae bacterium]MBR2977652.1 HNH endonuclease [Oscillospiraceae bacterium]